MQRILVLTIAMFSASFLSLHAQEFSGGFRAGLNFVTFDGPFETAADGTELEDFGSSTNFHIGAIANLKFTDIFSLRGELLYSQKGGIINFNGPSYWQFRPVSGADPIIAAADRSLAIEVTNSYIDIPISAVARLGRFEFSAGASVGFLVSSGGDGRLNFENISASGEQVDPFEVTLDIDYRDLGRVGLDLNDSELREINNQDVAIPSLLSTEHPLLENSGNYFETIDIGLIGGIAYYLNQGLFLGLRLNYGMTDITNQERDASRQELNADGSYLLRDDDDRNVNLQLSVGFSF